MTCRCSKFLNSDSKLKNFKDSHFLKHLESLIGCLWIDKGIKSCNNSNSTIIAAITVVYQLRQHEANGSLHLLFI